MIWDARDTKLISPCTPCISSFPLFFFFFFHENGNKHGFIVALEQKGRDKLRETPYQFRSAFVIRIASALQQADNGISNKNEWPPFALLTWGREGERITFIRGFFTRPSKNPSKIPIWIRMGQKLAENCFRF